MQSGVYCLFYSPIVIDGAKRVAAQNLPKSLTWVVSTASYIGGLNIRGLYALILLSQAPITRFPTIMAPRLNKRQQREQEELLALNATAKNDADLEIDESTDDDAPVARKAGFAAVCGLQHLDSPCIS